MRLRSSCSLTTVTNPTLERLHPNSMKILKNLLTTVSKFNDQTCLDMSCDTKVNAFKARFLAHLHTASKVNVLETWV